MNITLEQLSMFQAVVEYGGVNKAAAAIYKSPSAVSHALNKLQEQMGVDLFEVQGRKLVLHDRAKPILALAEQMLRDKQELLDTANQIANGAKLTISIAVDAVFPQQVLLDALAQISAENALCKVRVDEHILSGVEDAVLSGDADIGIGFRIPSQLTGKKLIAIPFHCVVSPEHTLANKKQISLKELRKHRQVVIADSGEKQLDSGWINEQHRWTTSNLMSAMNVVRAGLAYGRLPISVIKDALEMGDLVELDLGFDFEKVVILYAFQADSNCELSGNVLQRIESSLAVFQG